MKRTTIWKNMDRPQPTEVMYVRLLKSVLEMVMFGGIWRNNTQHRWPIHSYNMAQFSPKFGRKQSQILFNSIFKVYAVYLYPYKVHGFDWNKKLIWIHGSWYISLMFRNIHHFTFSEKTNQPTIKLLLGMDLPLIRQRMLSVCTGIEFHVPVWKSNSHLLSS